MRNLDLLAERALAEPVAAPSSMGSLRERARRHNQNRANARRVAVGLAVVVPLVVIGALVVDRPSTVRIEAVSGGTAEVGEVYGARLAGNGLVWPAEPVPLDQLLNEVAAEFLGWPAVEWDRSDLVGSERAVTATQPGRPDRRVAMQVRERVPGAGWQILSLYPPPRVLLTGGQLTGFDVDVPADAERVDVFHLDPVDGTQSWTTLIDDVAGASAIQLAAPVPAERAGTYLIVARDAAGEATLVTGLSLGSLDRLTVAIDALTGAGVPEPLPAEVAAIVTENLSSPVDLDRSVVITGIADGLDLFVVPFIDDSAVCFYEVATADSSWGAGCGDAVFFNQSGWVTSSFNNDESDGYTLVVLPDSIEFSPDLLDDAHASGRVAILPYYDDLDRLVVVDGVLTQRP